MINSTHKTRVANLVDSNFFYLRIFLHEVKGCFTVTRNSDNFSVIIQGGDLLLTSLKEWVKKKTWF
jgi:hypothetical protein